MGDLKQIKTRIGSVSNTAQITNAMQMVSATKMLKAQQKALKSVPYTELIYEIVSKMGSIKEYKSIYLKEITDVKNIAIVVVGTSRGFVGSQITSLISNVVKLKSKLKEQYPGAEFRGISIHKTGLKIIQNAGIKSDLHFGQYFENKSTTELSSIFNSLVERFEDKTYDLIFIVYTHFLNTSVQKPVSKQLLPISIEELVLEENKATSTQHGVFLFEPNISEILDKLLPEYFQSQIYTGILDSIASEHSARMIAMKNATDNALSLKGSLTLKYNRQRQAQITQQLIEVVNGRKKR